MIMLLSLNVKTLLSIQCLAHTTIAELTLHGQHSNQYIHVKVYFYP